MKFTPWLCTGWILFWTNIQNLSISLTEESTILIVIDCSVQADFLAGVLWYTCSVSLSESMSWFTTILSHRAAVQAFAWTLWHVTSCHNWFHHPYRQHRRNVNISFIAHTSFAYWLASITVSTLFPNNEDKTYTASKTCILSCWSNRDNGVLITLLFTWN